jgi:hypothetical protein
MERKTESENNKKEKKSMSVPRPRYFELHAHGTFVHSEEGIQKHGRSFKCPGNISIVMKKGRTASPQLMIPEIFQTWITSDQYDPNLQRFNEFISVFGDIAEWRLFATGDEIQNIVFSDDDSASDLFFGLWEKPFHMNLVNGMSIEKTNDIRTVPIFNHIRRFGEFSRFYNDGEGLTLSDIQGHQSGDSNGTRYTITPGNYTPFEQSAKQHSSTKRGMLVGGDEVRTLRALVGAVKKVYPNDQITLCMMTCTPDVWEYEGGLLESTT